MRENRTYGSEGGETGTTGLSYPYHLATRVVGQRAVVGVGMGRSV